MIAEPTLVVRFESDNRGTALSQLSAWAMLNGNRFYVTSFVGDAAHASLFYREVRDSDRSESPL